MDQLRVVATPLGQLTYILRHKRVKNLNLRLERDGQVVVSAPLGCPADYADGLIVRKADWIVQHRHRQAAAGQMELPPPPEREECIRLLCAALDAAWPLVEPLGVAYPEMKVRRMKSQWGNCHWAQGYITLNTALARCPEHLRVYVALHELVHFLHHDHGPGFYACMERCMPRWREYRAQLKQYLGAIEGL